jgi:endonuclease/exonuclease/phosphatase family metal-dependent hydrolase
VTGEPGRRIDYVFTTNGVAVQRFGTLTDQWRGDYPSDHLPVLAEVTLP